MTILYSVYDKADFESPEIVVNGTTQFIVTGGFGYGKVIVKIKKNGTFHTFPNLVFYRNEAISIDLRSGDTVKVVFDGCVSAGIEVRN